MLFKAVSTHLKEICRIGQGAACCRFIVGDGDGLHCAKLAPEWAVQINVRHIAGTMTAKGDNCPGKPIGENL